MTQARNAPTPHPRVAVIGAGVMGLAIGLRLAEAGVTVVIFDKGKAGRGASHAAAGMLAACAEAEPGEEALLAFNRASQVMWPDFAKRLEAASGMAVDLRREGTLVVALNSDDAERTRFHLDFQKTRGLPTEWISAREARRREPHLAAGIAGALWSPEDHQVDNRKVAAALRIAAERAGARIHEDVAVEEVVTEGGRVAGLLAGGTRHEADIVVLAAGAWSRGIAGIPEEARPPVRPVKGQMIALRMDVAMPLVEHVVWAPGVYMVPRRDGRLILGATVEERGFDETMTAGGVLSLLEAAWRAVPTIEELPIDEMWVGFRPGSRDDAPVLGAGPLKGLVYATGHHRNGILALPATAEFVSRYVLTGEMAAEAEPFALTRFAQRQAAE